uniref:Uncharacterized protein n=1 Tax=Panagrolaimus davidi TaxID=227884 RepID=A0A914PDK4_9BILA
MDETIWKQSLGRSVSLGDCYDATTEKFTGLNIFIKELPNEVIRKQDITNQSWNYDFSNSTTSKLSMLNLDGELKLSLLCDMLPNISGSAKFIKNKTTNKEEVRCTFALFTNTIEQRIEINDMALCDVYDKRIDSFKGTHVVTRLKWGANAVAELIIENDEKIGKTEITGAIKANLGKIGEMALSDATIQGNIKHESFDLSKVTKIRWSVNADVISNTKTPKNAEEALNIIHNLPEQIKENGNGRPLEFCLLPLKELKESLGYVNSNNAVFHKIESTAVLKVEQQFTEIESSRLDLLTLQNFMTSNTEFVTTNELNTVKEFLNAFDISFMEFQQLIAAKLNQIRSGKAEQIELMEIIEKFKKESNATSSKVKEFLSLFETMEERVTLLRDVTSKGILFIKNFAAFESIMLISKKDIYVLAYSFKSKKDSHQKWLENYPYFSKLHEQHKDEHMFCMIDFDITPEIQRNQNLPAEIQIHKIFNGKFVEKNIFKEIKLFESVCSVRCTAAHEKSDLSCDNRSPVYMPCASSVNGGQCSKKCCEINRSISDEEYLSLSDDEDEETRTTTCQAYTLSYGKYALSFIYSPGIRDKRGTEEDKKHLEEIFNYAEKYGSLNAICIVIKDKEQLLSNYWLMEYLSYIPQSFVKNILFCFTYDVKDKYNQNAKIFRNFVKHCEKISESDTSIISQAFKAHATIASISKPLFSTDQEIKQKEIEKKIYTDEITDACRNIEKLQTQLQTFKGPAKWQQRKDEYEATGYEALLYAYDILLKDN